MPLAEIFLAVSGLLPAAAALAGQNASQPGEVRHEPATLHCLAVRWPVKGDANRNAAVAVRYRKIGAAKWKQGYPLFRPHPDKMSPENRVAGGWLFAGSIVNLNPDTRYEVKLALKDSDGGDAVKALKMRTLAEPVGPKGMRVRHVVPAPGGAGGGSGTKDDPFKGLVAAHNAAQPGDLFLLHKGVYLKTTWTVTKFGQPGKPIIWRGAGAGEAILDGGGGPGRLISANNVHHVWFEDLTLRNRDYLIVAHRGHHVVVRRCRFQISRVGFTAINGGYNESRGTLITDCLFAGPCAWPRTEGIERHHGIHITGAGHVVAYNRFRGLADSIHGTSHGRLSASDFHNNEISECTDDGLETDYADTNVRVFCNRFTNCWEAMSAQPSNGGPVYFFRNAVLNCDYSPFKLHNHTAGVLLFHNTCVKRGFPFHIQPATETVNDVVTRNNLFIGTRGPALRSTGRMTRCDFDADGYGGGVSPFALWLGRIYKTAADARASGQLYREHGAILVDPKTCFATGILPPEDIKVRQPIARNDLRLKKGSDAIDRGIVLPNFSDGYKGKAPDLGCYEHSAPLPHYGPRPTRGTLKADLSEADFESALIGKWQSAWNDPRGEFSRGGHFGVHNMASHDVYCLRIDAPPYGVLRKITDQEPATE